MTSYLTKLENIPTIMRANNWLNGARLMEQWFSRPFKIKDDYGPPETSTIKLDGWLLTFPRGRMAYNNLLAGRIWTSQRAQVVLANHMRSSGVFSRHQATQWPFGNLRLPVDRLHDTQINHEPVSELVPTLDDMTAALGNFSLYVAVAGFVRHASTKKTSRPVGAHWSHSTGWPGFEVTVTDVAIWMMDSYDFNGHQSLGWWNEEHRSVTLHPGSGNKYIENGVPPIEKMGYTEVTNASFCEWRLKNRMGGDFRVFSDVKLIKLAQPDVLFLI